MTPTPTAHRIMHIKQSRACHFFYSRLNDLNQGLDIFKNIESANTADLFNHKLLTLLPIINCIYAIEIIAECKSSKNQKIRAISERKLSKSAGIVDKGLWILHVENSAKLGKLHEGDVEAQALIHRC